MNQVHAACDSLFTEVDHLDRIVGEDLSPDSVELALVVAKRARRSATLVVRTLATARDKPATAQEA